MRQRWQAPLLVLAVLLGSGAAAAEPPGGVSGAYDFVLAELLAAEGEVDAALEAFQRARAAAPDDPFIRVGFAELLFRAGRLESAAEEAAAARRLAPREAHVLRVQARIEMTRADRVAGAAEVAVDAFERLLELEPGDVEALVSVGQIHLAAGRAARAVGPLGEAARLRPGQPMIETLLARALAATGRNADAEKLQRELVAAQPENLGRRLELADLLAELGRHAEAAALLAAAPQHQAGSLEVRRRLAHTLYLAGDLDAARRVAEATTAEHRDFGGARLLLGLIELAAGNFEPARGWLEPLARQAPLNEQIGDLYARALERLGRVDEAAEVLLRRAAALETAGRADEAARARLERGRLFLRVERFEELEEVAAALLQAEAAELREQGAVWLADSLAGRGRAAEAIEALAGSSSPALVARRAELLLTEGREADAEAQLADLARQPGGELRVAEVHQRRGDYARSIPLLESLDRRDGESLELHFRLASAYERTGRIEEAVALFRSLLARAPGFAPAMNYLGYLWIDRSENLDEALALVREAVRIDPDNGAYVDSLGWGYFKSGRTAEAVAYLERAARLLPEDATVLEHLGDALVAAGEVERAREVYRRALATGDAEAAGVAAKLERLGGNS